MKTRKWLYAALAALTCLLAPLGCVKAPAAPCAAGHTPSDRLLLLAPTEKTSGKKQKICTVCGVTLEVEDIAPLASREEAGQTAPADPNTPDAQDKPDTRGTSGASAEPSTSKPAAKPLWVFSLLPNGTYAVGAGEGAASKTALTLPTEYEGRRVTEIAPRGFASCTALCAVTLPSGFVRIGDEAFSGCAALAEITLPDTLAFVGAGAFAGCALPVTEQGNGRYLGSETSPVYLLLSLSNPDVDYFAPAAGARLLADDAFAASPALAALLLPTSLVAVAPGLADNAHLSALYTGRTAAEFAALPGAEALPARIAVYTSGTWGYVRGTPAPFS